MQYLNLNKHFTFDSSFNDDVVREYIKTHPVGHRVFDGNFTGFNAVNLLEMLGCNVQFTQDQHGKYKPCIVKVHVYEQDTDEILSLIDILE